MSFVFLQRAVLTAPTKVVTRVNRRWSGLTSSRFVQGFALISVVFFGSPISAFAQAPTITGISAPRQVVTKGQSLTLSVTAPAATSYQWKRSGRVIPGATAASYTIGSALPVVDNGWYQAVATNASGSTTSAVIFVNVTVTPAHIHMFGQSVSGSAAVPAGLTSVSVVTSSIHSLALRSDGTVAAWGYNSEGQATVPANLTGVVGLACGYYHSVVVREDGTVRAWGRIAEGESNVPTDLSDVVSVAGGDYHTLALRANGSVAAWGYNDYGQTTIPSGLTSVVAIAAGERFSVALKSDGTVVAWGHNSNGKTSVPPTLNNAVNIAATGEYVVALTSAGGVVAWGRDSSGAMRVPSDLTGVVQVVVGVGHALALKSDGSVRAWGRNDWGQAVSPLAARIASVVAGSSYSILLRDGSGDATPTIQTQPVSHAVNQGQSVSFSVGASGGGTPLSYQWRKRGVGIGGATAAVYTLPESGPASAGSYDVLVSNYLGSVLSTVSTITLNPQPVINGANYGRYLVAAGGSLTLTLDSAIISGATVQWRRNGMTLPEATGRSFAITNASRADTGYYQAVFNEGTGAVTSAPIFVNVAPPSTQLVGWGSAGSGATSIPIFSPRVIAVASYSSRNIVLLADGTVANWNGYSPPSGLSNVVSVAAGENHFIALRADGTVVAWGYSGDGQLNVPTALSGVVAIAAGANHNLAVKSDGTVVAWGSSSAGATAVPAGLSDVVSVSAGNAFSLALKRDGSVVGWGSNSSGQSSVPLGLANVAALSAGNNFSLALRGNGTVTAWGASNTGPAVLPTDLSGIQAVAAGGSHAFALRADGTVAIWGSNNSGQATLPVGLNSVFAIAAGYYHSLALRDSTGDTTPTISVQPASLNAFTGQNVTLSVQATGGTALLAYQWRKGGAEIVGATGTTLALPRVTSADAANYDVVVSNQLGATTSLVAALAVSTTYGVATNLTGQQILSSGQSFTLTAIAAIASPVTFQWRRNGRAIAGATNESLSIAAASLRDVGVYQVVATNSVGPVVSAPVFVGVSQSTQLRAWGSNINGQVSVPANLGSIMEVAAGRQHSLALVSTGTVAAWGLNTNGQTNVPAGLSGVVGIAAGQTHSVALKSDGTVVTWGLINYTPSGLKTVFAIASTSYAVGAVREDGTMAVWDSNNVRTDVPAGLVNVVAIDGGENHWLALRNDGSVVAWGDNGYGQSSVPADLTNVAAISAGTAHSLALRADGTVIAWGSNNSGERNVPAGLSNVVAIAAGYFTSFALKADGTMVSWGTSSAAASVPPGLGNVMSLSVGNAHALALRDASSDVSPTITAHPVSIAAWQGQNATFSVTAVGSPTPTFQWRKNGVNIAGATNASFTIANVQPTDVGDYDVILTNGAGSITSSIASLTLASSALVALTVMQPVSVNPVTTTFTISGTAPKLILVRGVGPSLLPFGIVGAMADPQLTLLNASTQATIAENDNWGGLSAISEVMSRVGAFPFSSGSSRDAAIVVTLAPGTYSARLSGVGTNTGTALLEVYDADVVRTSTFTYLAHHTMVGGSAPALNATYVLAGATSRSLLVRALGPTLNHPGALSDPILTTFFSNGNTFASNNDWAGSTSLVNAIATVGAVPFTNNASKDSAVLSSTSPGNYSAQVVGVNGVSGAALLEIFDVSAGSVVSPPFFTAPPASQAVAAGIALNLHAGAMGSGPLTYQWRKNGEAIFGATNATLGFNAVQPGDAATYDVTVTSSSGTVLSPSAVITVVPPTPPAIVSQPNGVTILIGQTANFSVTANGTPPLTYQWRKAGGAISGATNSTFSIPNAQLGDAAVFDVVVSNAAGSVISSDATLVVNLPTPPSVVAQPVSGLVNVGNLARFTVGASGTAPLSFQWRRNGAPIVGANSSVYAFVTTAVADAAVFDVVVSNSAGSVVSAPATLSFGQLPLTSSPRHNYVRFGEPVTFAISPIAGVGVSYQWSKDGNVRTGATSSALTLPAVADGDIGSYSVGIVTGVGAPVIAGPAKLALRGTGTLGRGLVAVGTGGTLLTTNDGTTWISRSSGTTADLRAVAASGDLAIAVGSGGTVVSSTNFSTWSATPTASTTSLNGIAAGPDCFVTVGDAGRVLVSPDGFGWYLADSRTNQNLNAITYGKGLFVFAGNNGALFTSPDGFNWTNRNSQTTSTVTQLVYSGNQFWALTVARQLLTSPDGVTWTLSPASPPPWLRSLAFDGQKLVAVGDGGRVSTSVDGITWTPRDSGTLQTLLGVTWTGDELPSTFTPDPLLSHLNLRIVAPPLSFSALPGQPARFTVSVSGGGHAYLWNKDGTPIATATQDTLIIPAAGAADVAEYSVTITSAAGTLVSAPARLALIGAGALGSQFLAVGGDGTVLTSPDGLSFTARGTSPGRALRAVATSAFRAVAVGQGNLAAVSDNGATWSYRTLPGANVTLRGVAANATHFVAVGAVGTILTSPDQGETWMPVASVTTNSLWSVAWNGSRFLAVGDAGTVLMSLDGVSWSQRTSPTSERLYAVGANGESFVAVTEMGRTFTTSDAGATWQTGAVSGALWVRGAAMAPGGRRVIVGDSGQIASSPNGADWVRQTSPTTERLYGVTWSGLPAAFAASIDVAVTSPALRIVTPPASLIIAAGGTATFSVSAGGVSPLTYQWQRNGIDLPGAVTSVLILGNVQASDAATYTVLVSNGTGTLMSAPAALTVTPPGTGTAPVITESPASRSANIGGATTFTVVATGSAPLVYRWQFNGQTIPGALTATLALSHLQLANSGSYTVTVSNAFGAVVSTPAVLSVTAATGSPVITQHPVGQAVPVGGGATFLVVATGTGPLSYQWRKDGVVLAGATTDTLRIEPVALSHAGVYTATVTNTAGAAISEQAGLTVVPPGTAAVHVQSGGQGYIAGATVTITNSLSYVGTAQSIGWDVLLPVGWSLVSASGAQGDIRPAAGDTQLLSWGWTTPPPSPVNFSYTLQVPGGTSGTYAFAALAVLRQGGIPIQLVARADPLVLAPAGSFHSADTDGDRAIDLFELTRVIELYNTRNGTVRTGAYRVDATNLEDGFAADPARPGGPAAVLTRYHSADTRGATTGSPRDGALDLFELTRVIELYNTRAGTVRTGRYHVASGTEDGFAAGP